MRWTKLVLTCICFKKIKLTHHCFKSPLPVCSSWIDRKIRVSPTSVISSLSLPRCLLSSSHRCQATVSCHTSFPLSQDELADFASSSGIASYYHFPSRAKIEALNLRHHYRPPSLDPSTPILHCNKKLISTLATLLTTEPRLHFDSFLARAPRHRSSTRHHHSLLPPSHAHHLSAKRHPQ
jgi:hypothetical protein